MGNWLKQSTAVEIKLGPFVSSADGFTPMTALGLTQADVRIAKHDADWIQKGETTAPVHEENGWYRVLLAGLDTNAIGSFIVAVNKTGALPVWREFMVVTANSYDSMVTGAAYVSVNVAEIADAVWGGNPGAAAAGTYGEAIYNINFNTQGMADGGTPVNIHADSMPYIADAVWDEDATAHQTVGTFGQAIGDPSGGSGESIVDQVDTIFNWLTSYQLTPNNIASYVWNKDATAHQTPGTFGQTVGDSASDGSIHAYVSSFIPGMITSLPTELFDTSGSLETGMTLRGAFRVMYSALAGKVSGAGTSTETFRNIADNKNRIISSVDASGNRTSVTTDAT